VFDMSDMPGMCRTLAVVAVPLCRPFEHEYE